MPQTQRITQSSNQIKLSSQLGSALGWQNLTSKKFSSPFHSNAVYGLPVNQSDKDGQNDFKQKLLEVRLNDIAAKYCSEKNIAPVSVSVSKIKVTATKNADNDFVPIFADEALVEKHLLPTKFHMRSGVSPSLIQIFVFEADASKMNDNAADYQLLLNKEYNNTPQIEKALHRELWHHTLIERCRKNTLTLADLANLDIIHILQIHDAFIKSGLAEELIEQREEFLKKQDINLIDDKFILYKKALKENIIKPNNTDISGSEIALIADCVQDLFNARADKDYMQGRVQAFVLCRKGAFSSSKNPEQIFDTFLQICAEHEINGKSVNLMFNQSKENFISQSTIDLLKQLDRNLFAKRDEDAVTAYFHYDKEDLQKTLNEFKSSILKFYKNKEYLR